jgi:hypothetical protein
MWNKNISILYRWWNDNNNIQYNLECKELENYDKIMESHTNYLTILYNLALVYKQRLKKIYLAKVKDTTHSKSIIISLFFAWRYNITEDII